MTRVGYWMDAADIAGGGTGPYAWRFLENVLSAHDPRWQLVILCRARLERTCRDLVQRCASAAEVCPIPATFSWYRRAWRKAGTLLPARVGRENGLFDPWQRWYRSLNLDLVHMPYPSAPPGQVPCPWLVTMHDVQELHFPEFFTPRERAERAERNCKLLEACNGIVVSFDHVKQDMLKYFDLPASKVFVCPLPFRKIGLREPTPADEVNFQRKYGRWGDFLLYPAQTWPHKNHLGLIRALEHIKNSSGRVVSVLCSGRKNPRFFPHIEAYLRGSSVAEQVEFLDVVPEEELCWLYRHCALVVVPTLYEAGSFPLLEAMSLEVPVICSRVTSLPETIGDQRFTFDPLRPDQLAGLIVEALDQRSFREANLANGRRRTQQLHEQSTLSPVFQAWQCTLPGLAQSA